VHSKARWCAPALVAALFWSGTVAPAAAEGTAHVVAHVSPATAYVGSIVVVSGTVKPAGGSVVLERLDGKVWKPLSHAKVSRTGAYSLSVRVPRTAEVWPLRVSSAKAVSGKLSLRVTKSVYHVTATARATLINRGSVVLFAGSVSARGVKGTGAVWLQELTGKTWHNLVKGVLGKRSTYQVIATLPSGTHRLRVAKPFTAHTAGGASKATTVTVLTDAAVTTTTLPPAVVAKPYSATLTATGGLAPYSWVVVGGALPVGLALSAAGLISGVPTTAGTATVTLRLDASRGASASATLSLKVLPQSGQIFAWGDGSSGELGNDGMAQSPTPVPVSRLATATAIAGNYETGYALLLDGTVADWGNNDFGQLGNGTVVGTDTPALVPGLVNVTAIAGGFYGGYAALADGTVRAWGGNGGRIGDGTTTARTTPVQVTGLTGITAVASGLINGYALRSDGTVWAWGAGDLGQLGNGGTSDSLTPVQVSGLAGVIGISATSYAAYAVLGNGQVVAWGGNDTGQLGNGSSDAYSSRPVLVSDLSQVTAISGNSYDAYALRSDGTVWAWGDGGYGQLGNGQTSGSETPVQVSGISTAVAVSAGEDDGYAVLRDGTVAAWGRDASGQLGNDASLTNSPVPVAVAGLSGATAVAGGSSWAMALRPS
jgi:alpha-tubulin suppressor-like RCC1 family protein